MLFILFISWSCNREVDTHVSFMVESWCLMPLSIGLESLTDETIIRLLAFSKSFIQQREF
jgi:hypothetical protein